MVDEVGDAQGKVWMRMGPSLVTSLGVDADGEMVGDIVGDIP